MPSAQPNKSIYCDCNGHHDESYSEGGHRAIYWPEYSECESDLYALMNRLRHQGLATYRWEISPTGPLRKCYQLTNAGFEELEHRHATWNPQQPQTHPSQSRHVWRNESDKVGATAIHWFQLMLLVF
ncbi:PadR family transcriptional regulator [Paenarthrobacter sp. MSM-2-10-13]|nr:PadR family transcriptional regulator [Paenarthrobacter sp. MSM-2-10-13]